MKYLVGQKVYIIENKIKIREATIVKSDAQVSLIRFGNGAGTRLSNSRIYDNYDKAFEDLPEEIQKRLRLELFEPAYKLPDQYFFEAIREKEEREAKRAFFAAQKERYGR